MDCPKCAFPQPAGAAECPRCGIVFGKCELDRPVPTTRREPAEAVILETVEDGRLGRKEAALLASGLVAALIVYALPFTRFVLSAIVTLFHEFGHAVAAWLLGHPAIPAFDFVYGGGVTSWGKFNLPLVLLFVGIVSWLGWTFRRNPRTLAALALVFGLWLVVVSSAWRRELVISAAGHAGELILAGAFFYMTLANVGWRMPEIERWLGSFVAFFVLINVFHFSWQLGHDPAFLEWYLGGKGGAMMNDLEHIALDLRGFIGISCSVPDVAGWLLVLTFLPLPLAFLAYRFRRGMYRLTSMLRLTESPGPG